MNKNNQNDHPNIECKIMELKIDKVNKTNEIKRKRNDINDIKQIHFSDKVENIEK